MKKLSNYKLRKYKNNLIDILERTPKDTFNSAKHWYYRENEWLNKVANYYDKEPENIAMITARLSVRNKWVRNKIDVQKVCISKKWNIPRYKIKICTPNTHKNKAYDIYEYQSVINRDALKIYSFYNNLLLNDKYVTIDVWQKRALLNKYNVDKFVPNKIEYKQLEDLHISLAENYNLKGFELQSIIWTQKRNEHYGIQ